MARPLKPNATRKPPVPSDSHADIEDWIRRVMPDLHPIVKWKVKTLEEAQAPEMYKWIEQAGHVPGWR